jgi:4-diphosphocytidyl-2-C-methyl-D-erythritol kinase
MICYPKVKINLGLNVLRRREDGFHDLETLFVPCEQFQDTLEIIPGDDYSRTVKGLEERYRAPESLRQAISPDGKLMITIARAEGVDWEPLEDLTAKAYRLLDKDHKLPPVKIYLEKTSPVGAGLGGGSADAAQALKAISSLFEQNLSQRELAARASRLGSDCAFFIYDHPMFGSGRGEILTPMDIDLSPFRIEVVVPEGLSVSTADAYRGISPRIPSKALKEILRQSPETWRDELVNDFELTVFQKYPALARFKAELYDRGAVYASMSGSGSALFGLFRA